MLSRVFSSESDGLLLSLDKRLNSVSLPLIPSSYQLGLTICLMRKKFINFSEYNSFLPEKEKWKSTVTLEYIWFLFASYCEQSLNEIGGQSRRYTLTNRKPIAKKTFYVALIKSIANTYTIHHRCTFKQESITRSQKIFYFVKKKSFLPEKLVFCSFFIIKIFWKRKKNWFLPKASNFSVWFLRKFPTVYRPLRVSQQRGALYYILTRLINSG